MTRYAIQRTDSTGSRYVTPPGAHTPYFDTRHQAQHVAADMRAADPSATFRVVEVPASADDSN